MRDLFHAVIAGALVVITAGVASAQIGRVLGTVKDEAGNPIKAAIVRGENPEASPSLVTSATDDRGRFSIIGLGRGGWTFTAEAPGFRPQGVELMLVRLNAPNPPLTFVLVKAPIPITAGVEGVPARDLQHQLAAADALFVQQKFDEAITAYQAVIASAPSLAVINLQVAAAYRNKRDYGRAITAYRDVLKAEPENEKAVVGLAATMLQNGDAAEAERVLRQALGGGGSKREIFFQLAELELARGRSREAGELYAQAAAADPDWGKPLVRLGQIAMNAGNKEAATKAWQQAIVADPLSPEAAEARTGLEQLKK